MTDTKYKDSLVKLFSEFVEKHFGGSSKEVIPTEQVTKSVNDEQRLALFVVLEPQDGDTTTDLHGDTYTAVEVEKACHNFGRHCMKANLFHQVETEEAQIIENYISPVDFELDGQLVKKGTWLQNWYFPETEVGEDLWKSVKAGEINGVSIQCRAAPEKLND